VPDEIRFIPAGYRLCTHGIKVKDSPMDYTKDTVTIRFEEEAHVLGPDEICMVPQAADRG
jgi:hypothetical protein